MLSKMLNAVLPTELKFNVHDPTTSAKLAKALRAIITDAYACGRDIVIVCIGTDRSTGDALGPLTGSKLKTLNLYPHIFGTLEEPVHATNLHEVMATINNKFPCPFLVAVDACLGKPENIGYVNLGRGPVKPGAAVNKVLPEIGDVYITGTVNVGGFMEHLVLQSTRLNLVMKMADTIAQGLAEALSSTLPKVRTFIN